MWDLNERYDVWCGSDFVNEKYECNVQNLYYLLGLLNLIDIVVISMNSGWD